MFSGIVSAVGTVSRHTPSDGGVELVVMHSFGALEEGESIAVNGACLTVERQGDGWFQAHVIRTTLERTAIGRYEPGTQVNLERALRIGDRLGGHLVQGHVDGLGEVERLADRDDARIVDIRMPEPVARVTVPLGSVTVDGVSLTVNALPERNLLQVSLVPFTLQQTTLGRLAVGDAVHLEADAIGKYVAALLAARPGDPA